MTDQRAADQQIIEEVTSCSQGPAARRIEDEADIRDVIALMRLNYDRVVDRHGLPAQAGLTPSPERAAGARRA